MRIWIGGLVVLVALAIPHGVKGVTVVAEDHASNGYTTANWPTSNFGKGFDGWDFAFGTPQSAYTVGPSNNLGSTTFRMASTGPSLGVTRSFINSGLSPLQPGDHIRGDWQPGTLTSNSQVDITITGLQPGSGSIAAQLFARSELPDIMLGGDLNGPFDTGVPKGLVHVDFSLVNAGGTIDVTITPFIGGSPTITEMVSNSINKHGGKIEGIAFGDTLVSDNAFDNLSITRAVPEPTGLALIFAACALMARRRRAA